MATESKKNIRLLSLEELKNFFVKNNEPEFRAVQVYEWLWKKSVRSFQEMSNLSVKNRSMLNEHFEFHISKIKKIQFSRDGTIKSIFKLYDENVVEGVLIPAETRMTACISSQVGCSLDCTFCATGKLVWIRNLYADEMYEQAILIRQQALENYGIPLTNIVFMGMGEPLLNYNNLLISIEKLTAANGQNISPQRITVSTAGIAKMIKQLGNDKVKFNLAVSLHAADNEKRNRIMPVNKTNTLTMLAEALHYFYQETKSKITFEYIVFNEFNDTSADAKALYDFCRQFPCKINIIEYNAVEQCGFQNAGAEKTTAFKKYLEDKGLVVKIRKSRGKDIDAACGQLANKLQLF